MTTRNKIDWFEGLAYKERLELMDAHNMSHPVANLEKCNLYDFVHSIKVFEIKRFPANTNPFHNDAYHMGAKIGTNCYIMHSNHSDVDCDYIIVVNTKTGKRLKIVFDDNGAIVGDLAASLTNKMSNISL